MAPRNRMSVERGFMYSEHGHSLRDEAMAPRNCMSVARGFMYSEHGHSLRDEAMAPGTRHRDLPSSIVGVTVQMVDGGERFGDC